MDDKIIKLAKKAGFVFWEDEHWKPENEVIDWSNSYDKELVKFYKLAIKEYKKENNIK